MVYLEQRRCVKCLKPFNVYKQDMFMDFKEKLDGLAKNQEVDKEMYCDECKIGEMMNNKVLLADTLREQFEQELNLERPCEPYSSGERPEMWANILWYEEKYSEWLENKIEEVKKEVSEEIIKFCEEHKTVRKVNGVKYIAIDKIKQKYAIGEK